MFKHSKFLVNRTTLAVIACFVTATPSLVGANEVADSMNAMMMSMKAKSLLGHQKTTSPPGNQRDQLQMRRGGPQASHHQEAGCGGVAIGNIRPVIGDHRTHQTTVIVQGHILNTGNRC